MVSLLAATSVNRGVRGNKQLQGWYRMCKKRLSISTLLWITTFAAFALLPINRNTARQIWYTFDTKNAPKGGLFLSGVKRHIPYDYGDTWFARYNSFKRWMNPQQSERWMKVSERIIITEEEEPILLGINRDLDSLTSGSAVESQ